MRLVTFSALAHPHRGNLLIGAGVLFALGLTAGALINPKVRPAWRPFVRSLAVPQRVFVAPSTIAPRSFESAPVNALLVQRLEPGRVYAAQVLRVIDGDTFAARVQLWQGVSVDTHIRLRDIDAAELHARCAREFAKALAARAALQTMLADGSVTISRIGTDKYGGRIDASVATRRIPDVSAALLRGGYARRYDGGRRGSWCW
jgi:endonuclease YncB( thermonuclease family)